MSAILGYLILGIIFQLIEELSISPTFISEYITYLSRKSRLE